MNARRVNFGLWYDFRNPPPSAVGFQDLYRACLEQIAWAESLGFDSVWLTEHHFCEDGYTPSPLVVAAAIGERTKRMRIGTNLMLLPLADPVRLAEDAATLSILTGGRFDLGVGLGYRQLEFDYFGRQLKHRPSLMEEGIDIIRQAWSGAPVRIEGRRHRIDGLRVSPAPEQPPKLYVGGMAPPAVARAARLGDGFLSTGGIGHDLYVQALEEQGKPRSAGAVCAGNWSIIAADPEAEAVRIGEHVLHQANQYISWGAFGPPEATPLFPDAASAIAGGLYELCDAEGAVANLAQMLSDYPEIIDVHFWAQFPGEPVDGGSRRIEYIAKQVLPRLRAELKLSEAAAFGASAFPKKPGGLERGSS